MGGENIKKMKKSNIIWIFEGYEKRKKEGGSEKKGGGGWKFTHFTSRSAPEYWSSRSVGVVNGLQKNKGLVKFY